MTDAPIDIERMKEDMAAGTVGPWRTFMSSVQAYGSTDTYDGPVLGTIAHAEVLNQSDRDGRNWQTLGNREANARRIARLPDLEAAYLALLAENAKLREAGDAAFKAGQFAAADAIAKQVWNDGRPSHVYGSEWFIAKLDNGQKVVLRELPKEYTYDYTTADETYYAAFRVAKWMQFPDSDFIPYQPATGDA